MSGLSTLKLEATIANNKISMCAYEDGTTAPHYDETSVSLSEVFSLCNEIIALLNKSNSAAGKSSGMSSELKKAGQCLYDQLLTEAAKKKFRASKAVDLEVYIDEVLVAIPWELLFDGTQFLCLRFNMGRKVKTRQPSRSAGERTTAFPIKMLILADPTNDLPMARQESGIIEKQLDGMRKIIAVSKKVTNIDPVYVKKNLRDYDIVHYAGHADHDPANPSQSGWKLSGGQLTAEDIAKMGETAPLPALVFSNACRSAQTAEWVGGDFETQVFGLANAFLCAGVRHYIGTSWKIPDDTSLAFAKEFYAQLSQSKSVGEAIRLARLQIIKEQCEGSIVWASYVLYGDPASILFGVPKNTFFIAKWPMRKALVLCLVMIGMAGGVWGVTKISQGGGGDRKALADFYYDKGLTAGDTGKFDESQAMLQKALDIYKSINSNRVVDVEANMALLKALNNRARFITENNREGRIRATIEIADIYGKKFFRSGEGEEGNRAEDVRKKSMESYKTVLALLEEQKSPTAEHLKMLVEASFSLVMLYIPSDFERAEFYYEKFLSYARSPERGKFLNRILTRAKIFTEKDNSRGPCQGTFKKEDLLKRGLNADVVFERLLHEGWIVLVSPNEARIIVDLMGIQKKAPVVFSNDSESVWANTMLSPSEEKMFFSNGAHYKRVLFILVGNCSLWNKFASRVMGDIGIELRPDIQRFVEEDRAKKALEGEELKHVTTTQKQPETQVDTQYQALENSVLDESKRMVLKKYPELVDASSPKGKVYMQVLKDHPEYLPMPNGPILAMQEMEARLKKSGEDLLIKESQ